MTWIILTLLSALAGAITRIFQKVLLSKEQSNPYAFAFVFQIAVSLILLIYTIVTGTFNIPNLKGLELNLAIMAIFYALGNIFTFKAFKKAEASEVSIIYSSTTLWAVLAALIFLNEKLDAYNALGIFFVVLSIVAVNYSKTKWKINVGHVYAAIGAVLFGFAFTNDAFIINKFESVASYMVIAFALPALAVLFFNPSSYRDIPYFFKPKTIINLLLCSAFYGLSAVLIFTAYKIGGQASLISPLHQTSIIFTVILSYLLLKERSKMKNKITGMILAFIGVLLLII